MGCHAERSEGSPTTGRSFAIAQDDRWQNQRVDALGTERRGGEPRIEDYLLNPRTQDAGLRTALVEAALAQGLGPWLHHCLASVEDGTDLDPALRLRLRQSYLATTSSNLLILRALEALLSSLPDLRVVLIKGLALLPVYPRIGLRPLSDADLLIHPRDLPSLRQRLLGLGFQPEPVHTVAYDCAYGRELAFSRREPEGVLRLDIHWGLLTVEWFREGRLPDFDEIWARSLPGPFGGGASRFPAPEDLLLHLCLHQALHHSFEETLPYLDVAVLLRGPAPLDWGLFSSLARRSGWVAAAYVALERARREAGAPIPDEVLRELKPTGARLRLIERLAGESRGLEAAPPVGRQAARLLQLALADWPGSVLSMAAQALFPSERWLRLRYSAGLDRSGASLRLLHSARLMGLSGRAVAQLLPWAWREG